MIAKLWRGEAALARVFWEYTIGWATIVNLVFAGAALAVFVKDGPLWLGLLLHFAPIPLNVFLVVSIWRASAREDGTLLSKIARVGSAIWFVVMFVV
jgi:hypothetical protein